MGFANEARGLQLAGSNFVYMTEGAYGLIFVDREAGQIRKIYRRKQDEQHVRDVFKSETEAYRLAETSPEVAALIPTGFAISSPQTMVDRDGNDVSGEIFTDLAFETEFVSGDFLKIGSIAGSEGSLVRDAFKVAGILHTSDMSVVLNEHGKIVKAIDFAVIEHEVWAEPED